MGFNSGFKGLKKYIRFNGILAKDYKEIKGVMVKIHRA